MINNGSSKVHHIIVNLSDAASSLQVDLFKHAQMSSFPLERFEFNQMYKNNNQICAHM